MNLRRAAVHGVQPYFISGLHRAAV